MTVLVTDTAPKFASLVMTVDGLNVSATVTKAQFVPDEPNLEARTMAGKRSASASPAWTLDVEGLQDWFEAQNFAAFMSEHTGEDAAVVITWTGANGETSAASATVVCKSIPWGGTVDELATFSISLPLNGNPTINSSAGS